LELDSFRSPQRQVIPAKAGIQFFPVAFQIAYKMDSRFRGNDCAWEHPRLAKDTITRGV